MNELVLSIFPGIDLLGRAFEEEGFCVVRGPDVLWGGDIRNFHPPSGVFDGIIGGPPCQEFSRMRHLVKHQGYNMRFGNLIPEFERVVFEAKPRWFLMENVMDAPIPSVIHYLTCPIIMSDKWVGGIQPRRRRISFGTPDGQDLQRYIEWALLMRPEAEFGLTILAGHDFAPGQRQSILADSRRIPVKLLGGGIPKRSVLSSGIGVHGGGRVDGFEGGHLPGSNNQSIEDACDSMGLPRDFTEDMPFTKHGKRLIIGNAVPMPMGRAIAKAIKKIYPEMPISTPQQQ